MFSISSNHNSHDQQVVDALDFLRHNFTAEYVELRKNFPENIILDGAWIDTDSMGVDLEWSSWLCDAIENTGKVWWEDGEPYSAELFTAIDGPDGRDYSVRISKFGGGTIGESYAGDWIYMVYSDGMQWSGADLHTGSPHTHQQAAEALVDFLAEDS